MAWYGYDGGFAPYVPVAQKRARALRKAKQGGAALNPVEIEGRAIARTFWGQAWCRHIQTYSDYSNRLPRGRTYVRNGSVIDLQIEAGQVRAQVAGSDLYQVKVQIERLAAARWTQLVSDCTGKIDSVVELLTGQLSDGVMRLLCDPQAGVFPASKQLKLSCSCPDGARLCKHLAAVLYGVGARLDREPELLFVLRGVDKLDLVGAAAGGALAARPAAAGDLHDGELADIFGIELEAAPALPAKRKRKSRSSAPAT